MEAKQALNKTKTIAPKLRFKGFDGIFKNSKIGDFVLELKGGASLKPSDFTAEPGCEVVPKKAIVAGGKLVLDIQDRSFCTSEFFNSNTNNVVDKSFLLTTLRDLVPSAPSIGFIVQYDNDNKYILAQGVYAIKIDLKKLDKEFLIQFSNSDKYRTIMKTIKVGSTQVHIRNKDFFNVQLFTPTLPEQKKIASFLSVVDEKIQVLNRKKELLEQYKKGVMQQLFSGKLRFKDENGKAYPKWGEKRLDEVISKFIVPMRDKPKDLTGPIPWCRIEDFEGKYLNKSKSGQGVDLATIKEMNLKVYPIGTLLVSCSANLGFCAITKAELMTNQTFIGLYPDDKKADVLFLFYVMRRASVRLNTLSSGTTISYLSREQFEKFKIPVPSLLEQKKISHYLSSIDDKIESVDKQITQTQIFKKGLLQQMFV